MAGLPADLEFPSCFCSFLLLQPSSRNARSEGIAEPQEQSRRLQALAAPRRLDVGLAAIRRVMAQGATPRRRDVGRGLP
jgi:hypothetical protein